MLKIVIGVAGTIGAGKDTVTNHLRDKHGFRVVSMGDLVREEAAAAGIPESRENLQFWARKQTDKFGIGYWARKTSAKISELGVEKVAISGVRRHQDAAVPKKVFGSKFKLILVDADISVRFNRLKARKRVGDPKTLAEFKKQEQGEHRLFDYEKTAQLADFKIKNDDGFEDLYKHIDEVLKNLNL